MKSDKIRVSEVFESIQGEGRYAGVPMVFVRLSGCNRSCRWCDSKYHREGRECGVEDLVKRISKFKLGVVCWTGGEPLLQKHLIYRVMCRISQKNHLETNGTLLHASDAEMFDYIAVSPKDVSTARRVSEFARENIDIKVVTDLKTVGLRLIPYATMLMPLTVDYGLLDEEIKRRVWEYCVLEGLRFSPRLQVDVWRKARRR